MKFQFAGEIAGRGEPIRRYGTKTTNLRTKAAGWRGCIEVLVYHDEESGNDRFRVQIIPWMQSGGEVTTLAEGILDAKITDPFVVPAVFA